MTKKQKCTGYCKRCGARRGRAYLNDKPNYKELPAGVDICSCYMTIFFGGCGRCDCGEYWTYSCEED